MMSSNIESKDSSARGSISNFLPATIVKTFLLISDTPLPSAECPHNITAFELME
jgi:hypothetical protein